MNSPRTAPRTYPSRLGRSILKIRPASRPDPHLCARRSGPGSGSLGEFIEKMTPSVVISRLVNYVKKKAALRRTFLSFLVNDVVGYFVFPEVNSMFPGATPRRLQSSAYRAK